MLLLTDAELEEVLCHELIHAWQSPYCQGPNNPLYGADCLGRLKSELQAYVCAGQCKSFVECINRALASVCPGPCEKQAPWVREMADELYVWYKEGLDKGTFCPPGTPAGPPMPVPPKRPA